MSEFIIDLPDIKLRHRGLCGSKATNLGAIARRSRTGTGFCLNTNAYFRALSQGELDDRINQLAGELSLDEPELLREKGKEIHNLLQGLSLPVEVEEALYQAYQNLVGDRKGVKVAVRSSATVEDLPTASFAGQLESYLNRETWEEVKEAIIKCWASLWTERVINYRLQNQLEHEKTGMAVIIQEMVPTQVSGVMFTANPLTSNRQEIYIEAVEGLGDKLVQGEEAGEIYTINKETRSISSRIVKREYPLLTEFSLRQLAHEGRKMEYLFEDYQDVEWAFYNEELFILQTRPITTLADEELSFSLPDETTAIQEEIFINIQERFPEPILPLDTVIAKIYYLSLFSAYGELGYSVPVVDWRRVEQGVFPEYFIPPKIKASWRRLFNLGTMLRGNLMEDWQQNEIAFNKYVQLMQQDILKTFPMEIVLEYLEDGLRDFQRTNTFRYLLYIQYGSMYRLLQRLLRFFYGETGEELFDSLVTGQPQITMTMNRSLEKIAREIAKDEKLLQLINNYDPREVEEKLALLPEGEKVIGSFKEFLQKHGHREISQGLGGIAAATWLDQPEVVWGMVKSLAIGYGTGKDEMDTPLAPSEEGEKRLFQLTNKGWGRILPLKRIFATLIDYSRRYTGFREDSHFYLVQAMEVFRTLFLAIGQQLAGKGYLEEENNIMYLTFWEVKDLVHTIYNMQPVSRRQLQEKIATRRDQHLQRKERWSTRNEAEIPVSGEVLQGVGASHGQAKGPCRIIRDPQELHRLKPGDILVAQSTNPSWTPVFPILGGLVVEYGSALSHAAIIAREYGIPAVMGVPGVTKLLAEGAEITVDGGKGLVFR